MKRFFSMTILACMLCTLTLSGCKKQDAPKAKDTVIIAMGGDIMTVDPQVAEDTNSVCVYAQIYSKLVAFDQDMNIIPDIATSWTAISDTAVEFKLREDVFFHNGEKLTSEDVAFSIDRAVNSNMMSFLVSFIKTETDATGAKIATTETPDAQTIIVHTNETYSPTMSVFADPAMAIVNKKAVTEAGDKYETMPVGSGPFKYVERVTGDYITLTAFDKYYKGEPKVKNLKFRIIPEAAQRTIALEKGEIDIAYNILPNDKAKIDVVEGRATIQSSTLRCNYLVLNVEKSQLANVKVRQAMNMAIDRQSIVDTIASGAGKPATNVIAPGVFGFDTSIAPFPYDMEKAKQLMTEAGYPDGFTMNMLMSENQLNLETVQVIQSQWVQLGIDMKIEVVESGSFYDKAGRYEFDAVFCGWTTSTADADYTLYAILHSDNTGIPSFRTYANPKLDEYLEAGRKTFDENERKAAYAGAQKLLSEELPIISIYYPEQINGYNKIITGFNPLDTEFHELYSLEFVK